MSEDARLLERIEKLRDALANIRDRDPNAETQGGATEATYITYSQQVRQHAARALQLDDAFAAAKPAS
jgi:hypothetical protein